MLDECQKLTFDIFLSLQQIDLPWHDMHGQCIWVFYFCLSERYQYCDKQVYVNLCLAPIWEYQQLFKHTYGNPNLIKCIDYVWSGALWLQRRCDLSDSYSELLKNHKNFMEERLFSSGIEIKPKNALRIGMELAQREEPRLFSWLKKMWYAPPEDFSTALNWKAYDYWYFSSYNSWPELGSEIGSKKEILSYPLTGTL